MASDISEVFVRLRNELGIINNLFLDVCGSVEGGDLNTARQAFGDLNISRSVQAARRIEKTLGIDSAGFLVALRSDPPRVRNTSAATRF